MPDPVLPTFLIIGAGKCGTTSLWSYLDQHPDIGMSAIKEPSFFSSDEVHRRSLDWYGRLYNNCADKPVRGEASNSYSATDTWPHTIDRIAAALEKPKFLYIVRHPRARTESDFMQMSKLREVEFSGFLRTEPVHADKNMYLRTYERYVERFGEDRLMVLFYDDLRADTAGLLRSVCEFLGVDPDFPFDTSQQHGQSAQARKFLFGLGALRRTTLYADLSLALPGGMKNALRSVLSRSHEVRRPIWSHEDRDWFRSRYEAPSRAFLERVGRDPGQWTWEN